jgi:hypothetical protein
MISMLLKIYFPNSPNRHPKARRFKQPICKVLIHFQHRLVAAAQLSTDVHAGVGLAGHGGGADAVVAVEGAGRA